MKKYVFLIFALIVVMILTGCQENNNETSDITTEIPVVNERYPSFEIDSVNAAPGDDDVVMHVSLKDNPGFLTMAMNIEYDASSISLTEVSNGEKYIDYNFIGPKNMQSGCTASWFALDVPENIYDDVILELHFKVMEKAKSGSYQVSISRAKNGGVVDENKNEIIFNNATGYIIVK